MIVLHTKGKMKDSQGFILLFPYLSMQAFTGSNRDQVDYVSFKHLWIEVHLISYHTCIVKSLAVTTKVQIQVGLRGTFWY